MAVSRIDSPQLSGRWRVLEHGNNTFLTSFDGTNYLVFTILQLDDHDFAFKLFEPSMAPSPTTERYTR
jgi:hypothetical protein